MECESLHITDQAQPTFYSASLQIIDCWSSIQLPTNVEVVNNLVCLYHIASRQI